jgi:NAD(P)H dehydrogenase (quinone)
MSKYILTSRYILGFIETINLAYERTGPDSVFRQQQLTIKNSMNKKRIFILNGHPAAASLSRKLAETYADAAIAAGHKVRITHLHDLRFDSDFGYAGYSKTKPLEPALEEVLEDLEWSEHVVLTSPMWWGGLPAKLKGLIDRTFLPGRVFDTRVLKGGLPSPLLNGRSARLILTSDTPGWFMRFFYKNALFWQLRKQIFGFVGIKPARITHFSGASDPKPGFIDRWIERVRKIGGTAT